MYSKLNAKVDEPIKKVILKRNPGQLFIAKKGRVGDSPIAGAGLFADNNLGEYVRGHP